MVNDQESESERQIEEEVVERNPPGKSRGMLIFVAVGLVAAVGGFYSTFRSPPARSEAVDLPSDLTPPLPGPPGGQFGGVPAPAPPGHLDFLRPGLAERPTAVEDLVKEVKEVSEKLVEGFSDQSDAWEITGRLHFRLGDADTATKAWERCLELNPEYAYAYHGLAQAAAKRGDDKEAIKLYRRALALEPDAFESQIDLASALIDSNELEEAVALLGNNIVSDPQSFRGRVLLGMAHMQMGEYQKARMDYEAAIADQPTHANAHFGLFNAYTRLGELELAKEYREKYQELHAREREMAIEERRTFDDLETMCIDVAGTYFEAATVCFSLGHLAEAELLLVRAGVLDPMNIKSRQSLAFMYKQINQPAETVRILSQLAEIEPENPRNPVEMSRLLITLGNFADAEQLLLQASQKIKPEHLHLVAKAVSQRPDRDPSHLIVLSLAAEIDGDLPAAIEAMKEAIQLAPDQAELKQRLEFLEGTNAE